MTKSSVFTFLLLLCIRAPSILVTGRIIFEWKYINYTWPSSEVRENAIRTGNYNMSSITPMDTDYDKENGRTFVTMVRQQGVPASLGTISSSTGEGGFLITPYPNWSWHNRSDCSGLTGVYRMKINCGLLWVIDCGKIGDDQVCPPKVLAFDLKTDEVRQWHTIPDKLATNKDQQGLMVNIAVDNPYCKLSDPTIYISDVEGFRLLVLNNGTVKALTAKTFEGLPDYSYYMLNGTNFTLTDGILPIALTLTPPTKLYWRALSANTLCAAYTKDILKAVDTLSDRDMTCVRRNDRSAALAVSKTYLVSSGLESFTMYSYDMSKPFRHQRPTIIDQNKETLQFVTGIKGIDFDLKDGKQERVWAVSNRFQRSMTGTQNITETNFRIHEYFLPHYTNYPKHCATRRRH